MLHQLLTASASHVHVIVSIDDFSVIFVSTLTSLLQWDQRERLGKTGFAGNITVWLGHRKVPSRWCVHYSRRLQTLVCEAVINDQQDLQTLSNVSMFTI